VKNNRLRLYIIECPSINDDLMGLREAKSIQEISNLLNYQFFCKPVRSKAGVKNAIKFLESYNKLEDDDDLKKMPLCIHIASHGNKDGLRVGADRVSWEEMATILCNSLSKMERYDGPLILVISACDAVHQKITKNMSKKFKLKNDFKPPKYLFVTESDKKGQEGNVFWEDAIVGCPLFYKKLATVNINRRGAVQNMLKELSDTDIGTFHYSRWNGKDREYKRFPGKKG
jgi:hypothetical protein